jgi:hypothetical protein
VFRKIYRVHLKCRALAADCAINVCHIPKAIRIRIIIIREPEVSPIKDPRFSLLSYYTNVYGLFHSKTNYIQDRASAPSTNINRHYKFKQLKADPSGRAV